MNIRQLNMIAGKVGWLLIIASILCLGHQQCMKKSFKPFWKLPVYIKNTPKIMHCINVARYSCNPILFQNQICLHWYFNHHFKYLLTEEDLGLNMNSIDYMPSDQSGCSESWYSTWQLNQAHLKKHIGKM